MRNFTNTKRLVVKIGTNTLSVDGGIDTAYVRRISTQVKKILDEGRQVILVTSGAIGMGVGQLGSESKPKTIEMRQACAAIGQPLLMQEYRKAFLRHNITVAQVLLTTDVLNNRKTYLNLRNSIETLLKLGVVPIINENDSVSTDEIGSAFGDNDRLSAYVASKIDADLLILLSDIDAMYDKDPRKNPDAKPIRVVYEVNESLAAAAGTAGSKYATGGMKTKIEAAKIAANAGCRIVLAHGHDRNILARILAGSPVGSLFMPKRKLSNRKRWILNSTPKGTVIIDEGAINALRKRKSLLPTGIIAVKGNFEAGDVVKLNDNAKAVISLSSTQLRQVAGKHSREITNILGRGFRDVAAIPEDIVFLEF